MKSFCLLSLILPVLSVQDSAPLGCGSCDLAQCAPLPAEGCAAGSLVDSCGCCSVCAAAEGELCGGRRSAARRCGSGLECVRSGENKKNKMGVCVCKSKYEVCGTNGVTYMNTCALKTAGLRAQSEGKESVNMQNKGRCGSAPLIVTPPGEVYNVSGSQVYLSCEVVGVPTPVLTWKKILSGKKMELLPGDRDNLAIQTRGGPEKHEVTGWVLKKDRTSVTPQTPKEKLQQLEQFMWLSPSMSSLPGKTLNQMADCHSGRNGVRVDDDVRSDPLTGEWHVLQNKANQ
uniref:Insulin-like growth factor binding protein 7 n=1 Tax=Astatotilapia calliptera TaxID=8154 RepID=A0AAX7TMT8_ASTCA